MNVHKDLDSLRASGHERNHCRRAMQYNSDVFNNHRAAAALRVGSLYGIGILVPPHCSSHSSSLALFL